MIGQRGFTLIETLAAGLISVMVGGATLSVLYLTNTQLQRSRSALALGQMQTAVLDQLRSDARQNYGSKAGFEDPGPTYIADPPRTPPNPEEAAIPGQKEIFFTDHNGSATSRYRINTTYGILEEWDKNLPTPAYVPFMVAGQPVTLDADNSWFGVLAGRRGVTYQIVCRIAGDVNYDSPLIQETMYTRFNL